MWVLAAAAAGLVVGFVVGFLLRIEAWYVTRGRALHGLSMLKRFLDGLFDVQPLALRKALSDLQDVEEFVLQARDTELTPAVFGIFRPLGVPVDACDRVLRSVDHYMSVQSEPATQHESVERERLLTDLEAFRFRVRPRRGGRS